MDREHLRQWFLMALFPGIWIAAITWSLVDATTSARWWSLIELTPTALYSYWLWQAHQQPVAAALSAASIEVPLRVVGDWRWKVWDASLVLLFSTSLMSGLASLEDPPSTTFTAGAAVFYGAPLAAALYRLRRAALLGVSVSPEGVTIANRWRKHFIPIADIQWISCTPKVSLVAPSIAVTIERFSGPALQIDALTGSAFMDEDEVQAQADRLAALVESVLAPTV